MWEASNEALLAGFVTGDPDAAAAFIRRFQRRGFGLARAIVGDPPPARGGAPGAVVRGGRAGGDYDAPRGAGPAGLLAVTREFGPPPARVGPDVAADDHEEFGHRRRACAPPPTGRPRRHLPAGLGGRGTGRIAECRRRVERRTAAAAHCHRCPPAGTAPRSGPRRYRW